MSTWGTLHSAFTPGLEHLGGRPVITVEGFERELERRDALAPTGSEEGTKVRGLEDGSIIVAGRLRDVSDTKDSPMILAWFVHNARWCERASLMWEVDLGPRYRFEWHDGQLHRLRGVLD